MYVRLFLLLTSLKVLMFYGYKSTDFEVHRNWLAITSSLPTNLWYFEKTSEWTLDYPPLFAYFEYTLSQVAKVVDPNITDLTQLNYSGTLCILFQRVSVLVSELVLVYSLYQFTHIINDPTKTTSTSNKVSSAVIAFLTLSNPSLFFIDHIHFQYNGFMYGILLLSLNALYRNQVLLSSFLFVVLLCFKHIYLYCSLAYFVYILFGYVRTSPFNCTRSLTRLGTLATLVLVSILCIFYPFLSWEQLVQIKSRLFPFQRGLLHAYWAPNLWSLYALLDRVLVKLVQVEGVATASTTRGLVGDVEFFFLPNVLPHHTFLLTLLFLIPSLMVLAHRPTVTNFFKVLSLNGFTAFQLGYHVHEKAILLALFTMVYLTPNHLKWTKWYLQLHLVAGFSNLPLLINFTEACIGLCYLILWSSFAFSCCKVKPTSWERVGYSFMLPIFCLRFVPQLENTFLPLLLTSTYSALFVAYIYFSMYFDLLTNQIN